MTQMNPPYKAPTEVSPGIFLVPIPIPIPLRYVNCYACKGPTGWTLVDTGFNDPLGRAAWPRAFADLGIGPQDVERIVVTHYHPDHLGGAGWLQEWTGAPVYLHDKEIPQVELFWGGEMEQQARALGDFFREEGMAPETADAIVAHHHDQWGRVMPLPEFTPIHSDSRIPIGSGEYQVIWLPGHSDGLAIFYDETSGIAFLNDMMLNKITPNVSLWPACRTNPLQDYLASLAYLERLGARLGLPGHRSLIENVSARAAEIRAHHQERLDLMEQACRVQGGATAWDVCQQIFQPQQLTIHQVRFAMSETLAHLVYLKDQGRLRKEGDRFTTARESLR